MVTHLPKETTDLAIQLCTGYTQGGAGEHPADPHPEDYMDIFLDDRKALTVFLQVIAAQAALHAVLVVPATVLQWA